MKLKIERHRLGIVPESETDIAYIEEVLGIKDEGDTTKLERVNVMGTSKLAYIFTERRI